MLRIEMDATADRIPSLLHRLRRERRISQKLLADMAGVNASVVHRAERGGDAKLSTWNKLFEGLGYRLVIAATESDEVWPDVLSEEADRRLERVEIGRARRRGT